MSRLTKKTNLNNLDGGKLYKINADYSKCEDLDDREMVCAKATSKIIDKLGVIEDIEEDLGISIPVIHKALTEGVWVRLYGEGIVHVDKPISLRGIDRPGEVYHFSLMYEVSYNTYQELPLREYGKIWAVTKEELE